MTKVVHTGGAFIVQEKKKKGEESTFLTLFWQTKVGKDFIRINKVVSKTDAESPDFLLKTEEGKTIGIEVVEFILQTKKVAATARLESIGNKIVGYFKKKRIPISLLLEIYDKRKHSPYYADMVDRWQNPGFDHLNASDKEIKDKIIAEIEAEGIKDRGLTRKWIDIKGQTFVVYASTFHAPHTSCHVNNEGMCTENPFDELQSLIDGKNKKYDKYKQKCDECYLLVVSSGGFVDFTDKIKSHKFKSAFRGIYLLDLGFGSKATKLKNDKILQTK